MVDNGTQGAKTFFRDNFGRLDWTILGGAVVLFFSAIWYIVDLKVTASSAEVRADLADVGADLTVLTDEVEDTSSELTERFDALKADLTDAFETHAAAVGTTFERGMQERTDELSRALAAQFTTDRTLTVQIANVPRNDPQAMALVQKYVAEHGSTTTLANFADKMVVTSRLDDLDGMAAQELQYVVEEMWSEHPGIETALSWEAQDGPGVMYMAPSD